MHHQICQDILGGFESYIEQFQMYTRLAPIHFKNRDWNGMQYIARSRMRLYKDIVKKTAEIIISESESLRHDHGTWISVKEAFRHCISDRKDKEIVETFYNSVCRKVLPNIAVSESIMFVQEGFDSCPIYDASHLFHHYPASMSLEQIIRQMMDDFAFDIPFIDKEADIQHLIETVKKVILSRYLPNEATQTQLFKSVFYRNKAAYLIGRTFLGGKWFPFIIPILHNEKGLFVDTLIFDPKIMGTIFSYTRSYFLVEVEIPSQFIAFLKAVLPYKDIHELYNAIGYNKHGKTELYRDFLNHLRQSTDQFEVAAGIKGMVMTVFTLPSYNMVFKLIKDNFDPPKTVTRAEVKKSYKLVSLHDRVGRMADTHEFEYFKLPRERFTDELIAELRSTTPSTVEIKDREVIFQHLYTERRMIPLNIFLEEADTEEALAAVEEYGLSIKQLAAANIFPGDMLTKNFGVTRQRRVVFYDYDEIVFLTDCNFRFKPKAETFEQIYAPSPWYEIAPNDVFPEDFERFMIGREDLKSHFKQVHGDLFDPAYWQGIQKRILEGELVHAYPYPESIRFYLDRKV